MRLLEKENPERFSPGWILTHDEPPYKQLYNFMHRMAGPSGPPDWGIFMSQLPEPWVWRFDYDNKQNKL